MFGFVKNGPKKRLCHVIAPATASPNAPNKTRPYATSEQKMHDVKVWYPRLSLALDHVQYQDENPGITPLVIHAKDFPARALCSASLDYSIQHSLPRKEILPHF